VSRRRESIDAVSGVADHVGTSVSFTHGRNGHIRAPLGYAGRFRFIVRAVHSPTIRRISQPLGKHMQPHRNWESDLRRWQSESTPKSDRSDNASPSFEVRKSIARSND
jgi:hypothetical protein